MTALEALSKHIAIATDVPEGGTPPEDCVAHWWLVNKDFDCIASRIVLSKEEFEALKEILEPIDLKARKPKAFPEAS